MQEMWRLVKTTVSAMYIVHALSRKAMAGGCNKGQDMSPPMQSLETWTTLGKFSVSHGILIGCDYGYDVTSGVLQL